MKDHLRQFYKIIIFILITAVFAAGCQRNSFAQQKPKEKTKSNTDEMYEAYRKALQRLYRQHNEDDPVFPDGNRYVIKDYSDVNVNYKYAISDVTGDGIDDLILDLQYANDFGYFTMIFDYVESSIQMVTIRNEKNEILNYETSKESKPDQKKLSYTIGLSLYKNGYMTMSDIGTGIGGETTDYYRFDKKSNSYQLIKETVICNFYGDFTNACKVQYSNSDSRSTSDYFDSIYAIAYEPDDSEYLDKNDTVEFLNTEKKYNDYINKLTDNAGNFDPEWNELTEENIKNISKNSQKKSKQVLPDVSSDPKNDQSEVLPTKEPQFVCDNQKSLGTVRVLVKHLYLRVNPDVPEDGNYGYSPEGKVYPYYKTTKTEHYTWYKVSDCEDIWLADPLDNPGSYLEITDASQ